MQSRTDFEVGDWSTLRVNFGSALPASAGRQSRQLIASAASKSLAKGEAGEGREGPGQANTNCCHAIVAKSGRAKADAWEPVTSVFRAYNTKTDY